MTLSLNPPHGQPHSLFREFTSTFGGWVRLCKEFVMAEDCLHFTVQHKGCLHFTVQHKGCLHFTVQHKGCLHFTVQHKDCLHFTVQHKDCLHCAIHNKLLMSPWCSRWCHTVNLWWNSHFNVTLVFLLVSLAILM